MDQPILDYGCRLRDIYSQAGPHHAQQLGAGNLQGRYIQTLKLDANGVSHNPSSICT
jgi:hypothetical protein